MHWREPLTAEEQDQVINAYKEVGVEVRQILIRWKLSAHRFYSLLAQREVPLRVAGRGPSPQNPLSDQEAVAIVALYESGEAVTKIAARHNITLDRLYRLVDAAGVPRRKPLTPA